MAHAHLTICDLVHAIESVAPPALSEPWDNTGLLIGTPSDKLDGPVLLTIDLSDAVLSEAIELGAGAILAYHPPIFSGMKRFTPDSREGRLVLACAGKGIAVYSPHTALDAAENGLAEWLVRLAGAGTDLAPITASESLDPQQSHKIVTFIPAEHAERLRDALASAGAGNIGGYSSCSFTIEGTGSFFGNDGTKPAAGKAGKLETVRELRLEMVAPASALPAVVAALRAAHPYDEPAFEIYQLHAKPSPTTGGGRIMTLSTPASPADLARTFKQSLGVNAIKLAAISDVPITRIAACPGAGGSMIDSAIAQGATMFVTGEMRHHDVLAAMERGCSMLLAGHTNTERPYLPTLAERLGALLSGAPFVVSENDSAPFVNVIG